MATSTLSVWARTELLKGTGFSNIATHIRVPDDDSNDVSDELAVSWGNAGQGKIEQDGTVTFEMGTTQEQSRTFSKAELLHYDENASPPYVHIGTIYFDEPLVTPGDVEVEVGVSGLSVEFPEGDLDLSVWTDVLNGTGLSSIITHIIVPDEASDWETDELVIAWNSPSSAKVTQDGAVTFSFTAAQERDFQEVKLYEYDENASPPHVYIGTIEFTTALTVENQDGEAKVENIEIELEA